MKKIGLFFGSFNPIHVGHLIISNFIVNRSDLAEVWLVVSPQNPFKKKSSLLDEKHRYYIANLAVEDNYDLRVSNIEFGMPQPSYTIDTLTHLQEKYPDKEFVLIMGSDNLASLHKWKNYEQILAKHEIIVYPRSGNSSPALASHEKVRLLEVPYMDISSTFIRNSIKNGHSIRYFVTDKVRDYIDKMNFYR